MHRVSFFFDGNVFTIIFNRVTLRDGPAPRHRVLPYFRVTKSSFSLHCPANSVGRRPPCPRASTVRWPAIAIVCSAQLRFHEIRLIASAYRTSARLKQPTALCHGWSANLIVPQFSVPQPVRCLIGFQTSAVGSRFRFEQGFHRGSLRDGPFFGYGV